MTATELTYRSLEERDLNDVLSLWEESSGWGAITEEQFRQWYLQTPYGPCLVVVAVDASDQVVGQLVFGPSRVRVKEKEVKALRATAPILSQHLQYGSLTDAEHPIYGMFAAGIVLAKQKEYSLIYLYPAATWTKILKLFPKYGLPDFHPVSCRCFSLSLQATDTFCAPSTDLSVQLLTEQFTAEYDQLWKIASEELPVQCGVVRNASWLNWKLGNHAVFEIRRQASDELNGYVAIKKETGLLTDAFAKNKANLLVNIQAVVHALHGANKNRIIMPWSNINGMYSPLFQKILPTVDLVDFSFAFGCCSIDEAITYNDVDPFNWFMMPND